MNDYEPMIANSLDGVFDTCFIVTAFYKLGNSFGHLNVFHQDFPGGAVVKNPPANAGDTGLIPGLGRCYMPWSN